MLSRKLLLSAVFTAVACLAISPRTAPGQNNNGGGLVLQNNNVGGISIDATGVVTKATAVEAAAEHRRLAAHVRGGVGDVVAPTKMRMVSLRGLEAALIEARENKVDVLPEEVRYLAGLQRVEYIFVYPETNDIVLAGPAEGWKLNDKNDVVGVTSGLPVLHLHDLMVALQTANNANEGDGISCSFNPTEEGNRAFAAYMRKVRTFTPAVKTGLERAVGPRNVVVTGVPQDSHFAQVLVAADYQMKRYAMHLDRSPTPELGSFLDVIRAKRANAKNMSPRWWLTTDYETLARSEDRLSWQIRGKGVKCMTEDDFVNADGERTGSGKADPVAQAWADMMTNSYENVSKHDTVFRDLRNLMDLSVVGALIEKEGMLATAKLEIPALLGKTNAVQTVSYTTPKKLPTQCSFTKIGREWVITASGGVQFESWAAADNNEVVASVGETRLASVDKDAKAWWWN